MKKIRTASVRATTAEIEAEQNEKRQRNNSGSADFPGW